MERYSDETTTGRVRKARHPKVTIAARAESHDGFQWFAAWRHDFAAGLGEVKSATALQIRDANPAAATRLTRGLSTCPIFIVDLVENTKVMLSPLRLFLPRTIPDDVDLLQATQNPKTIEDVALGMLSHIRQLQVLRSSMGAVESLISHDWISDAMRRAGLGELAPNRGRRQLLDWHALVRLSDKEFATVVGRFSVAMADALSPEAQVRVIAEDLNRRFCIDDGHVAYRLLEETISHDYVFDPPFSRNVSTALDRAHGQVVRFLEGRQYQAISRTLKPGLIREEDSETLLGIQVADIAAGVAADTFERSGLQGLDGARRLRRDFERVFLNRRWID